MGLPKQNIITWQRNGIEYYYPVQILQSIYGSTGEIEIDGDIVKLNAIEYSKNQLAELVVDKLTKGIELPKEFLEEFMSKISVYLSN